MYDVTDEIKQDVLEYCKSIVPSLNLKYLEEHNVYKNEFLDFLYAHCIQSYKQDGDYTLTQEEIAICFSVRKRHEYYSQQVRDGKLKILGIDKNDNLIIDQNEINLRTEVEREEH